MVLEAREVKVQRTFIRGCMKDTVLLEVLLLLITDEFEFQRCRFFFVCFVFKVNNCNHLLQNNV